MNIMLATNGEDALLEGLTREKGGAKVAAVFGRSAQDAVGGHIPSFSLPVLNKKALEAHISKAHSRGLKFYYLLTAPYFAKSPYSRQGHQALEDFFAGLNELKIDGVILNSPYLLKFLKSKYPQWKITVSWQAGIDSVAAAKKWLELGADALMVDPHANRDFSTLKALREHIGDELWLLANHALLWEGNNELEELLGAAQSSHFTGDNGYYLPSPGFAQGERLLNKPAELVRARWIRPEDLSVYEGLGLDKLVILDAHHNTDSLLKYVRAYQTKKSPANLLELLALPKNGALLPAQIRYFLKPEAVNIQEVAKISELLALPWEKMVQIDGRKLDQFLSFFMQNDCRRTACEACRHCDRAFEAASSVDAALVKETQEKLAAFQGSLIEGKMFRETETAAHGLKWAPAAEQKLAVMMNIVPALLREVCLKATRARAEANALERGSITVETQDAAQAFLVETPESYKRLSLAKLTKMGMAEYL